MKILFTKKKTYYLLCALAVLLICLAGDMVIVNEEAYSVFRIIWESPKEIFPMCDVGQAFDSGVSGWFSLLLPVVSLPFASFLSDERRSGFYLYVKGRQGTSCYLRNKLYCAFVSNAAILFTGIGIYILIIACSFPLNPNAEGVEIIGAVEVTAWGLCRHMTAEIVYFLVYSMALSMLIGMFIYLYNDLCVDFCLVFLFNYLFFRNFEGNRFLWVFLMMAAIIVLYLAARRFRSNIL